MYTIEKSGMNIEELRDYCLKMKGVTESFPFDETTLVFKVAGKMFCLTDLEDSFGINIKNSPEKNIELREQYNAVKPGFHMNKKHWNSVDIDGSISDELLKQWLNESYKLVVKGLTKKQREELEKR